MNSAIVSSQVNELGNMILLGFRYLASSIPLVVFAGVGIGVGLIFSFLLNSIARNPLISNALVRWAFIGFSLVEVSGFIGLVYSFLLLYAFVVSSQVNELGNRIKSIFIFTSSSIGFSSARIKSGK